MQAGSLRLDVTYARGCVRLDWRGRSTEPDPSVVIGPFLEEQRRRARSLHERMELHFEELEFFNSATISLVIDFVKALRDDKVPVEITYLPGRRWQHIFFGALQMFEAPGVLAIKVLRA